MNSKSTLSPLAPERFPDLPSLAGLHLGTAAAEIKYEGRDDVLLVTMDIGTTVAGVFTRSKTASAPVEWCRKTLSGGQAQALVVNSGNANAFTGRAGDQAVEDTVEMIADTFMYRPSRVFTASTGVIGEPLPVDRIVAAVAGLKDALTPAGTPDAWQAAQLESSFHSIRTIAPAEFEFRPRCHLTLLRHSLATLVHAGATLTPGLDSSVVTG